MPPVNELPPPGWYPDPWAAGTQWRWWDGQQWGPPADGGYGHADARGPASGHSAYGWQAPVVGPVSETASKYGRWFRFAIIAMAVVSLTLALAFALIVRDGHFFQTAPDGTTEPSGALTTFQALSWPLNALTLAHLGLFIAWIYQAGKFAAAMHWPARRNRTLGAFSLLIPIVQWWFPYEAMKDACPPGRRPVWLLRWWLAYVVVPTATFAALLITGLLASVGVVFAVALVAAVAQGALVALGWKATLEVEELQRTAIAGQRAY